MKRRLASALLLLAVFGTGCGRSSPPKTASGTATTAVGDSSATTSPASGGSASTTTARGGRASTTTTARAGTSTTVGDVGPTTTTTTIPVTVAADHACVHPTDEQGIKVVGPPNAPLIYGTIYSDKSDELTNRYGSGSGRGKTDEHGVFHETWRLAPNVPSGPATLRMAVVNGRVITLKETTFIIKAVGVPC